MPEITEQEFLRQIRDQPPMPKTGVDAAPVVQSASVPAQSPGAISLLPLAGDALQQATSQRSQDLMSRMRVSTQTEPDFASKLGARPGVPFDTQTGVPFMSRLRMAAQPTPQEEVKALEAAYGKDNVRLNQYGAPIVTVTDSSGQPKDLLANPLGIEFGSLATFAAQAPELIGAAIGTVLSRGKGAFQPGMWNALKTLIGSSAGTEVAGGVKDVGVRALEGTPQDLSETAARRAGMGALDLAAGGTMGFFVKAATKLTTPFAVPGPLNFKAREAAKYFQDRYGVALPLTPGELTGSTFLQRTEAMALQKPGSSIPLDNIMKERNKLIGELQLRALGGYVPEEEAAAQRAIATLGAKARPLEDDIAKAAQAASRQAEQEITAGISASTGIGAPVNKGNLGADIRKKALDLREQFKSASSAKYNEVFSDPLTQTKNISGTTLAKDADALLAKLPAKENITQTVDYDTYGSPILRDIKGKEVLREFVPDGVLSKVKALSGLKGQEFRLDELMQMRREIDNDIALGESVPGVQTRYLGQIRDSITARIKTGLDELSPDLRKKWEAANDFYATEVQKFKKAGIAELYRDPEQASFLGDTAIVTRATQGRGAQDFYQGYKDFFGENSIEFTRLRRAVADDVLDKSPLSDTIDGAGFVRRLEALASDAPDVLQDVFGMSARQLRESGQVLKHVQKGNLPEDEIVAAVQSGNLSGEKLLYMLTRQNERDQAYRNTILKAVADGNLKADKIKPTEFVNKLAFHAEPAELNEIMSMLGDRPDIVEDIRRLTFKKILDDATVISPSGEKVLSGQAIEKALDGQPAFKRFVAIMGRDTFTDLEQLADFLKAGEARQAAFKSAGGIAGGQQVAGLVERGEMKYVERALKNFFLATAYTSPALRAYFGNTLIGPKGSANVVNYAIASTPFLEATIRTFGVEKARDVVTQAKASTDRFVSQFPSAAQTGDEGDAETREGVSEADFLNQIRGQ